MFANALRHLRRRCYDAINVDDIVRETGVSRRSLDRHAKRLFGHSTLDEIQRLRLERATRLLSQLDLTIAEVAKGSGFEDVKYFHRIFKKQFGTSPALWRKSEGLF